MQYIHYSAIMIVLYSVCKVRYMYRTAGAVQGGAMASIHV